MEQLIKMPEAARMCGLAPTSFKGWLKRGIVPAAAIFKPTKRCLRFRRQVLEQWIAGQLPAPAPVKRSPGRPRKGSNA